MNIRRTTAVMAACGLAATTLAGISAQAEERTNIEIALTDSTFNLYNDYSPMTATVTDLDGNPLEGVVVRFEEYFGEHNVLLCIRTTSPEGEATCDADPDFPTSFNKWIAGEQVIMAHVPDSVSSLNVPIAANRTFARATLAPLSF